MNEQVYKKVGRKYVPIGYSDGWSGFPTDGIWLVQGKDGHHSSECIMKIGDLESMQPAANLILGYKEKILDYLSNYHENNSKSMFSLYGISMNDFVLDMLKEITK